jgi:hypothetical protein
MSTRLGFSLLPSRRPGGKEIASNPIPAWTGQKNSRAHRVTYRRREREGGLDGRRDRVVADRPEVAFGVEFEDDAGPGGHDVLRIVHRGGESVLVGPSGENEHENPLARNLFIVSTHSFEDDTVGPGFECSETDPYVCPFNFDDEFSIGGERMAAGDTYRLYGETPSTPLEDATLRIVWRSEGRAESQVLFEWNGPGA